MSIQQNMDKVPFNPDSTLIALSESAQAEKAGA